MKGSVRTNYLQILVTYLEEPLESRETITTSKSFAWLLD